MTFELPNSPVSLTNVVCQTVIIAPAVLLDMLGQLRKFRTCIAMGQRIYMFNFSTAVTVRLTNAAIAMDGGN